MAFLKFPNLAQHFVLKQRALTQGEKALACQVFGDYLKLDDIQIVAHRLILKNYAISPNGWIYFNVADWCEDFSKQSLSLQSWLIHELTHIWQLQNGIAVIRKALFDRRYDYVMKAGKSFLHYGVEQQAQMVQDYFVRSRSGQSCEAFQACIPFLAKEIKSELGADKV